VVIILIPLHKHNVGGMVVKHKAIKLLILFIALAIISNLVYAVAVTGAIGNGITVIPRQNVGEGKQVVIDRELIVINKNDFTVNITLEPDSGLKDIVELIDKEFPLNAKEEKKAKFKIILEDNYEHSGKISVYFRPDKGNGIVLASKIIILGDDNEDNPDDEIPEVINNTEDNNTSGNVSFSIGGGGKKIKESSFSYSWLIIVGILIVVILGIIGFIFLIRK